ncbi:MAG: hypothetical protein SNF33_05685 [Candidatus Algichlamydia australiensis]|nr:hypothetical protein [Chlamydiales bacterium]
MAHEICSRSSMGAHFKIYQKEGSLFALRSGCREMLPVCNETNLSNRSITPENIDSFWVAPSGHGYVIQGRLPGGARKKNSSGTIEELLQDSNKLVNWMEQRQIRSMKFTNKRKVPLKRPNNIILPSSRAVVSQRPLGIKKSKLKNFALALASTTHLETLVVEHILRVYSPKKSSYDDERLMDLLEGIKNSESLLCIHLKQYGLDRYVDLVNSELSEKYLVHYSSNGIPTISLFRKVHTKDMIDRAREELKIMIENGLKKIASGSEKELEKNELQLKEANTKYQILHQNWMISLSPEDLTNIEKRLEKRIDEVTEKQKEHELRLNEMKTEHQMLHQSRMKSLSSKGLADIENRIREVEKQVAENNECLKWERERKKMFDAIQKFDKSLELPNSSDVANPTELFYNYLSGEINSLICGVRGAHSGWLENKKGWKQLALQHLIMNFGALAGIGATVGLGAAAAATGGALAPVALLAPLFPSLLTSGLTLGVDKLFDSRQNKKVENAHNQLPSTRHELDWTVSMIAGAMAITYHQKLSILSDKGLRTLAKNWVQNWSRQIIKGSGALDEEVESHLNILFCLDKKAKKAKIKLANSRKISMSEFYRESGVCYQDGQQLCIESCYDTSRAKKREITNIDRVGPYYFQSSEEADYYKDFFKNYSITLLKRGVLGTAKGWISHKLANTKTIDEKTQIIKDYWNWKVVDLTDTDIPSHPPTLSFSYRDSASSESLVVSEARQPDEDLSLVRKVEEVRRVICALNPGKTWDQLVEEAG